MAFYNLSSIISKFLKKITLTQEEKDEICEEIGAVSENNTSYGGEGDEDADHLVMFGPLGQINLSNGVFLKKDDESTDQAGIFWEDPHFTIYAAKPGIGGATLIFPSPESGSFEYNMPRYSCTVAGVDDATGFLPKSTLPHVITTLEVANETERLALTLEEARNKIIIDNENIIVERLYVLKDGETNPADPANWVSLGDTLFAGLSLETGRVPIYGTFGGLAAKSGFVLFDEDDLEPYNMSWSCKSLDDKMSLSFLQGANLGTFNCPVLDADYTWTLPLASGTLAVDTNVVMVTGDQSIAGFKVFTDSVGILDDLGVSGDLAVDGSLQVLGDIIPAVTKSDFLAADETPVASSIVPVDSSVSVTLGVGKYLIKVFAYFTHGPGGSRVKLDFSGTIAPNGGYVQIGSNGSSTVSNAVISTDEGVFGDLTRDVGTDSHYITEVYYDVTVAGTLTLQFAQAISDAADTTLKAGTRIIATRFPS